VYEARRLDDDKVLAVKLLRDDWADDDEMVARLLTEKRVLAGLDHPNIVKVHDLVIDDGRAGIVMERVGGGTLRPLIENGPMSPARVTDLGRQLALALDAAHADAVVHGDVKPENVLVASADPLTVKLSDFGIARIADAAATRTTSHRGTPNYMAPEVWNGDRVGPPSDVYSLGVLLYEALAGRLPFSGTQPAVWKAHVDQAPARPDGVGDAWWALLARMLAKAPADRPTAAEVAAGLAAGRAEPDLTRVGSPAATGDQTLLPTEIKDRPARTPSAPGPARRRSRRPFAVGGAAVLVVTAGALAWMNGWIPAHAAGKDVTVAGSASPSVTSSAPPVVAVTRAAAPSTSVAASAPPSSAPSAGHTTTAALVPAGTVAPPRPTVSPKPAATSKPAATRAATKAPDTTAQCQASSNSGGLDIGPELNNSGGPNHVPDPCSAIWLTLTEVHYITYAKACLEDGSGTDTRCGGWIYLEDGGAWNKLLDGVSPGDRWQLYLKAQGEGHVSFDFSG
jgi:hypothetical protein